MTFEKKIRRGLGVFASFSGICLAVVFGLTLAQIYTKKEYDWLTQTALITSGRFDDVVSQSEMVSTLLLSDQNILTAITTLSQIQDIDDDYSSLYFDESYRTVRVGLNNYFTKRQFYRAIFYNENGVVIAGNSKRKDSVDPTVDFNEIHGISGLSYGELTIIPCHLDEWGKNHNQLILSVIKRLVGARMGYIEVQWTESDLTNLLLPADSAYHIFLYNEDGSLLYSSDKEDQTDYFQMISDLHSEGGHLSTQKEVVAFTNSQQTHVTTVIVNHMNLSRQLCIQILPGVLLLLTIFFMIAFIYSRYSAQTLTRPIHTLRNVMEQTNLYHMPKITPDTEQYLHSSEEIAALYHSFFTVMERLSDSIEREKKLSVLQLQAQFDLLQAQVNPHFLYNVLNIISAKSIMDTDENENICDICSCLGQMLRYSTNNKEKMGTIRKEKEYLQLYFNLLKYRYEDRLEYCIQIEPDIEEEELPKIVLQQIVENSVTHGYSNTHRPLRITVTGNGRAGCWFLNIHDNGGGFDCDTKQRLELQMTAIKQRLSIDRSQVELEIGGMGLINTYARLFLVYGDALSFSIRSDENGTDVSIGINVDIKNITEDMYNDEI